MSSAVQIVAAGGRGMLLNSHFESCTCPEQIKMVTTLQGPASTPRAWAGTVSTASAHTNDLAQSPAHTSWCRPVEYWP